MTTRKLIATGLAAVAGVLALTSDASAFGKRKRGGNCNSCGGGYVQSYAASGCSSCGGGYATGGGWGGMSYASAYGGYGGYAGGCSSCGATGGVVGGGYAVMPSGGVPAAMPAVQGGTVTPASGTTNGNVVPASGTTTAPDGTSIPQSYVIPQGGSYVYPAGGYYQGGNYVYPAGGYGSFDNGFGSGVVQGALGLPSYGYGNYGYGSTVGGTVGNWAGQQVGRGLFRR